MRKWTAARDPRALRSARARAKTSASAQTRLERGSRRRGIAREGPVAGEPADDEDRVQVGGGSPEDAPELAWAGFEQEADAAGDPFGGGAVTRGGREGGAAHGVGFQRVRGHAAGAARRGESHVLRAADVCEELENQACNARIRRGRCRKTLACLCCVLFCLSCCV